MSLEARPAPGTRGRPLFPPQWTDWNGDPPADVDKRAGWIRANIAEGEARRAAGERIAWLANTTGDRSPRTARATRRPARGRRRLRAHSNSPHAGTGPHASTSRETQGPGGRGVPVRARAPLTLATQKRGRPGRRLAASMPARPEIAGRGSRISPAGGRRFFDTRTADTPPPHREKNH